MDKFELSRSLEVSIFVTACLRHIFNRLGDKTQKQKYKLTVEILIMKSMNIQGKSLQDISGKVQQIWFIKQESVSKE